MTKQKKLPVIFRKWPESDGGGVDAMFPTLPGTNDPYTCTFYAHIGQHSSGDPNAVIQQTKPARPEEYADLLKELHSIGYRNLEIKQRYQYSYLEERRKEIKAMDERASKVRYAAAGPRKNKSRNSGPSIGTTL